jgi:hypothetical protein
MLPTYSPYLTNTDMRNTKKKGLKPAAIRLDRGPRPSPESRLRLRAYCTASLCRYHNGHMNRRQAYPDK